MPDRRFRDMRLTEDEVEAIVFANLLPGHENHDTHELVDRAQRLLPLWRQWGIRDTFNAGWDMAKKMLDLREPKR